MLGPGSEICVGNQEEQEDEVDGELQSARLTAIWRSASRRLYLITCAHAFRGNSNAVFLPGNRRAIARLRFNLLRDNTAARWDVAIAELIIDVQHDAESIDHLLRQAHVGDDCYWLRGSKEKIKTKVAFHPARNTSLGDHDNFIQTPKTVEIQSDSGAPLLSDDGSAVLGLLTGINNSHAFYTPLANVFPLLKLQLR